MKWLKSLFVEEKYEDPDPSEIAVRVAEIQARIAAFRSSYPWSEESVTDTPASSHNVVETKPQPVTDKSKEMDLLKAKLLGKKL